MDGILQLLRVTPFQDPHGLSWLMVVAVPGTDFMQELKANTQLIVLVGLAAII